MWEKIAITTLNILFKGIACLPLGVLYVISDFLFLITYYLIRYRRKVVRKNLTNSFPEKTASEIKQIERKFYRHFTDNLVETIKLLHISDEEMKRRFRFNNIDFLEHLREDGRPIFLYLGHYGNWEYVTSITLWMKDNFEGFQAYHPLSNKILDQFIYQLRGRFHTQSVPAKTTPRAILTSVRNGRQPVLGLIADQRPRKKFATTWMRFLQQETPIITGGEEMGRKLKAHFIYLKIRSLRRGYYDVTLSLIEPDEQEAYSVTKQFMRLLEKDIQEAPQYWLWSHNRWKFRFDKMFPRQKFTD